PTVRVSTACRARLPPGTGESVPDPTHHADLLCAAVAVLQGDDVTGVEPLQIVGRALLGGQQRLAAAEVGTGLGLAADAEHAGGDVDGDHLEAILLAGIGQAVGHGSPPSDRIPYSKNRPDATRPPCRRAQSPPGV